MDSANKLTKKNYGKISLPDPFYNIEFDIFPIEIRSTWASIFHIGNDNRQRGPGVWFYPNSNRWACQKNKVLKISLNISESFV